MRLRVAVEGTARVQHTTEVPTVNIGISVFLIAVGAVMTFALDVNADGGVNIDTIGIILMVVGALGLLVSMTVLSSWSGRRGDTTVIREERE